MQIKKDSLLVGDKYHWTCDPETKLVYLGKKGVWHQFAKTNAPDAVWCEVLDDDLHMLEETKESGHD